MGGALYYSILSLLVVFCRLVNSNSKVKTYMSVGVCLSFVNYLSLL